MRSQRFTPRAAALAGLVLLALPLGPGAARAQGDGARVRPPAPLTCPRNQLTMYGGEVQRYQRRSGQTRITIATDWGTTETVVLQHAGRPDASAWYLLEGQAFKPEDWPRIEASPGRLRAPMRAAAWVCDDGRNATVDWQPPRTP